MTNLISTQTGSWHCQMLNEIHGMWTGSEKSEIKLAYLVNKYLCLRAKADRSHKFHTPPKPARPLPTSRGAGHDSAQTQQTIT